MELATAPLLLLLSGVSMLCVRWWIRCRFRTHLSTLLMMSLCAGGLMWLNLRPIQHGKRIGWPISVDPNDEGWQDDEENDRYERYAGWPIVTIKPAYWKMCPSPVGEEFGFYRTIYINADSAFVLLTLVAYVSDHWRELIIAVGRLRRRNRKPLSQDE